MPASSRFRSGLAAPSSTSEVARATGSSARVAKTLRPIPITTASPACSARIPASFRSSAMTSFGHFSRASTPVQPRTAATTATPASRGSQPHAEAGTAAGRSSTENVRAARGGLTQVRPSRPRPGTWASAASTVPSAPPRLAWAARSALVDPVDSVTRTSRHRLPGRTSAARSSRWLSGRRPDGTGRRSAFTGLAGASGGMTPTIVGWRGNLCDAGHAHRARRARRGHSVHRGSRSKTRRHVASLRLSEPGGGRPQQAGRQGTGPPHDGQPAARPRTAAEGLRQLAGGLTPRMLWRNHRLFTVLALISLVPRILAALAFRPALLTADSFLYMQGAMTGSLGVYRPSGYSLFLRILQPLPNVLLAVTTIQHLMGIAIAAIVYGLLRYWGLPAWGAALAAAPTLFDTRQIALESYILPDTLYTLVLLVTVALLLTRRTPRTWQCALAGLLMAYVSVLRGNGLPLAVVVAAFLLVRRVGWRAFTAGVVAFCAPFLVYVADYHAQHGSFNISSSDGIFLWSRTT